MNTFRMIVTGSRDWSQREVLMDRLDEAFYAALRAGREVVLVHGACPRGADLLAEQWAVLRDANVERHPADWRTHGNGAGVLRNQKMVNLGADLVLAFPMPCVSQTCPRLDSHYSHGTADCIRRALRAGIEVRQIAGVSA